MDPSVRLGIEACKSSRQSQKKEAAIEAYEKRGPLTKNEFVHAFRLSNKAMRVLLLRELMFLGRFGGLITSVHGLREQEPQFIPILSKALDFA